MGSGQKPLRSQLALLMAVRDRQVVYRAHRPGRRRIVCLNATEHGQHVTGAVRRLQARGWISEAEEADDAAPFTLTVAGQAWVDVTDPCYPLNTAAATPALKQAQDGREEFLAGDEGDAPSGAVMELDDEAGGGYWQRQGHVWIPVQEADALAALGIGGT